MGNFFVVACGNFYFATVLERNFLYIIDKSTVKCIWICFVTVGRRTTELFPVRYGFLLQHILRRGFACVIASNTYFFGILHQIMHP